MQGFFQAIEDAQEKADMARLLNVNEDDVAIMAEKGGEISTTAGGLRAANAKSGGALIEAVKNNVALDAEQISLSAMELRKELRKAYDGLSDAQKVDLNNEVNAIVDSAIEAGATKEVANSIRPLFISRAMVANPDNPAQFYKDHPLRFQKGDFENVFNGNSFFAKQKPSTARNVQEYINELNNISDNKERQKLGYYFKTTKGGTILLTSDSLKHTENRGHPLTADEWDYVLNNFENPEYIRYAIQHTSQSGIPISLKFVLPNGRCVGIVYSMPAGADGTPIVITAAVNTSKGIDSWLIKNQKASEALYDSNNATSANLPGSLSLFDMVLQKLDKVKPLWRDFVLNPQRYKNVFNQLAWHGSPYRFRKFDLGAIGTGEGAQVFDRWFACDAQITVVE